MKKVNKNVIMWILSVFMLIAALIYLPSFASIIMFVFAVIAAPIPKLQQFFENKGLRGMKKGVLLVVLFFVALALVPAVASESSTLDFIVFFFGAIILIAILYWWLRMKYHSHNTDNNTAQTNIDGMPQRTRSNKSKFHVPTHYVVFDIETTGFSRKNDRIIEIAANKYLNGELTDHFHSYINPEQHIPNAITRLTGIKNSDITNAPCIKDIKKPLLEFFGSATLVGHNIKVFDIPFLENQLNCTITNNCIDTFHLAKQSFPGLPSYKLSVLDQVLQLGSVEHHRAENDIAVNNALLLACSTPERYRDRITNQDVINNIKIEDRRYPHTAVDIHSIVPSNSNAQPNTALTGKNIVFSGELNILREEAYQIAVDAGAVLKSHVSQKTDYLVQGLVDKRYLDEDGVSSKQRRARELIVSGYNIQIIDESEFLYLANQIQKD